jgi:hypothetical protein
MKIKPPVTCSHVPCPPYARRRHVANRALGVLAVPQTVSVPLVILVPGVPSNALPAGRFGAPASLLPRFRPLPPLPLAAPPCWAPSGRQRILQRPPRRGQKLEQLHIQVLGVRGSGRVQAGMIVQVSM